MKFSQFMYFLVENNKKLKKKILSDRGSGWAPMTPWGSRSNIGTKCRICGLFRKKNKMGDLFLVEAVLGAQS